MSPWAPPEDWTRVLVRPRYRGAHRDRLLDLEGVWSPALDAWVLEPAPVRLLDRESREWKSHRDLDAHRRMESGLRDLNEVELEWQVGGPSALPRRHEDVEPTARTNRGWKTPKFPGRTRR